MVVVVLVGGVEVVVVVVLVGGVEVVVVVVLVGGVTPLFLINRTCRACSDRAWPVVPAWAPLRTHAIQPLPATCARYSMS